jgi:hypothetical protein
VIEPPQHECWLHPGVEVRRSPISGRGLFAAEPIAAGAVVSRLGGQLVSAETLRELFTAAARDPGHGYIDCITVDIGLHLVLPPRRSNGYGNHGCDPNLWWVGPYELAARHDSAIGDELTNDYATSTDAPDFVMACSCGSGQCRTVVTGSDWRRPDLRERYGEHWVPALLVRIRADEV